jgi:hypothetical protein
VCNFGDDPVTVDADGADWVVGDPTVPAYGVSVVAGAAETVSLDDSGDPPPSDPST